MKKEIMVKKIVLLLVPFVAFMAMPVFANGQGDAKDDGKIQVSVVLKASTSEYWNTVREGCEAAAEELGVEITVVGPNAETEIAAQVSMIEEQVTTRPDALIIAPLEESAVIGASLPALDMGIPVLALDSDFGLEGKTTFVGTSNKAAASMGGEWLAKQIGSGKKVVLIAGQMGEATSGMRMSGFTEGLESNGVEVLDVQSGLNTAEGAIKVMEDYLIRFQGEISGVCTVNDDEAIGAIEAIKQSNDPNKNSIMVVGFNGDTGYLEVMNSGQVNAAATVAQQPYLMGKLAVEAAVKTIKGETVPSVVDVPANLISKENLSDFLK